MLTHTSKLDWNEPEHFISCQYLTDHEAKKELIHLVNKTCAYNPGLKTNQNNNKEKKQKPIIRSEKQLTSFYETKQN